MLLSDVFNLEIQLFSLVHYLAETLVLCKNVWRCQFDQTEV